MTTTTDADARVISIGSPAEERQRRIIMAAKGDDHERYRELSALRPPCPDWCLKNWCKVEPVVDSDGRVMHWTGWHVAEIHGLESGWGLSYELAAVSFTEAPEEKLVLLRVASREDSDEMISILSTDESASLRAMLCYAEQAVNYKRGDDEIEPASADDGIPQR